MSHLNNSSFSIISTNTIKRKCNLKEKFNLEGEIFNKFQDFLNSYTPSKNILFLVDTHNNLWELIKRADIHPNNITNNMENLISVISIIKDYGTYSNRSRLQYATPKSNYFGMEQDDSPKSRLINIEIKENEISFNKESELDISKLTDLNFSNLIRDIND
jgi:hypothetical protein